MQVAHENRFNSFIKSLFSLTWHLLEYSLNLNSKISSQHVHPTRHLKPLTCPLPWAKWHLLHFPFPLTCHFNKFEFQILAFIGTNPKSCTTIIHSWLDKWHHIIGWKLVPHCSNLDFHPSWNPINEEILSSFYHPQSKQSYHAKILSHYHSSFEFLARLFADLAWSSHLSSKWITLHQSINKA